MIVIVIYFLTGALAGLMSGLIGIGGGLLVVPLLAFNFHYQHFASAIVMHLAAGTSLAVMIMTAIRSLLSHLKHHISFWSIYKKLAPGVVMGTIVGALLAHSLHSRILSIIFGIFVLIVALKMAVQPKSASHRVLPGQAGMTFAGGLIGLKSGLLGLGGGALTIPFLTHCNTPIRKAVVVSIACSLTVAIIGTISFMLIGWHAAGLPQWTIGYIYWPAWLFVVLGSICFAPLGVRLSHRVSTTVLRRIFSVFLLLIGLHMLFF